jgi:hypothetical protein
VLGTLSQRFLVRTFRFSLFSSRLEDEDDLTFTGEHTHLGAALDGGGRNFPVSRLPASCWLATARTRPTAALPSRCSRSNRKAYLSLPWVPGYWTMNDEGAASLRSYLRKGGFLIFDDFRGAHWSNFEQQMRRVVPEGRLVELDATNPICHSFFEINSLEFVQLYDRGLSCTR